MEASSELPLATEDVSSVLFAEGASYGDPHCVEEEFPTDLPVDYDWMLQPASRRTSRRALSFVAVTLAVLLIAISVLVVHNLSQSFPKVLASPSSSSR